ncbi:aerobic glycerol-3-phosphate dehydrogenase [Sporosarcina sp. NCCP-2716]|uniref:glycerol-3-phosphate dehydrogenase/oxidase n=1 Tax=Sporosarcina sp. NCCP-2716 TaxID=2943679 RepID=UPI002040609B|nr:FAD-dependent oxidoreductase [Sporosarcina sp. NCCP-2716]GKV69271.1 aerobic glycerol-3-phosphate dehydrogenase [Sporosarcina sp. NCCP-2716]
MTSFSNEDRERLLNRISGTSYDLVIIGGGITGTGIALDAASRGLKTLLVEMQDFAAGTSSRSTKLVHGGLRYLKQFEVKLVAEVGRERAIVYRNAPHVTHPEWMLLPFYKDGTFGQLSTAAGLQLYDFLAGVKKSERRTMLSREEVIEHEPLLNRDGLVGGGEYVEYRTDDARLTMEVAKKAREQGADLLNYTKVTGFLRNERGPLNGVALTDVLTGRQYETGGTVIVNAAGPWVEQVMKLEPTAGTGSRLLLTKGVHLVFDRSVLPLHQPIYFDAPDGRMIFAIPRNEKTYVGTTDTVFDEDIKHPGVTLEDKQYLLRAITKMFPEAFIGMRDIESTWSGVRPLIRQEGKGPSEISRKDEVWESDSGLLSIAGGKLTGYRKMAQEITDMVVRKLKPYGIEAGPCITKDLPLSGGDFSRPSEYPAYVEDRAHELTKLGLSYQDGLNIASMYGTNTNQVAELISRVKPSADLPLAIRLTLQYAIDFEMAMTPSDYFIRRTGALFFDIRWAERWKEKVTDYMADEFKWTAEQKERHARDLDTAIAEAKGTVSG